MRRLTNNIKSKVLALLKNRLSTRKVAQQCGISQSSVERLRKKYLNLPVNFGGRPRILNDHLKRRLVRYIQKEEAKSASMAAKLLEEDMNIKCSRWTVRRSLRDMNFTAMEKKKKPYLSKKNIKARLAFAKKYKNWTVDDWKKVIWSDETKINRFGSDGRSWCWIRRGEKLQKRHVKETVKFGGGSLMMWGCFTWYGVGSLCRVEGRMNQWSYGQILRNHLQETMENMPIEVSDITFQQDRDPKHTAKTVQEFLKSQAFKLLDWPAQSPDLNPIENLWAFLKKQLHQAYESQPSSLAQLWERVEEQWVSISQEYCKNLIVSMPRRLAAVRASTGLWTKY